MRDYRIWLSLIGLFLAGRMLYPALAGDRSAAPRETELQEVVYVCRQSGETFVLRAKEPVEKHPRTGQASLMPGLYCEKCRQWRPSPPLDVLQQDLSARLCPKDRTVMIADGPKPQSAPAR